MPNARNRICDVARDIFAKEGAEGISMRRVAADVGITATAIYRHFADKKALVSAIVEEGFMIFDREIRKFGRARTGPAKLMQLVDRYVDFILEYPKYFDFMFLLPRSDVRRYPDDFQQRESNSFNVLLDLVTEMMEAGQIKRDDVLGTSMTIWSQMHGLASLHRCGRFGNNPEELRKSMKRSLKRLLNGLA